MCYGRKIGEVGCLGAVNFIYLGLVSADDKTAAYSWVPMQAVL